MEKWMDEWKDGKTDRWTNQETNGWEHQETDQTDLDQEQEGEPDHIPMLRWMT